MSKMIRPRAVARYSWLFIRDVWMPLGLLVFLTAATTLVTARHSYQPGFHTRWSANTPTPKLSDLERNQIITERWKRYGADLSSLGWTLKLLVTFIIVAAVVVTNKNTTVTIPWIGATVPTSWLYIVVPVALLYLWLEFGFLLNELINSRAALWLLQPPQDPHAVPPFTMRSLLDDNNFVDGYFLSALPDLQSIRERMQWVNRTAFAGYVLMLAMSHAVALGLIYLGVTRARGHLGMAGGPTVNTFLPDVSASLPGVTLSSRTSWSAEIGLTSWIDVAPRLGIKCSVEYAIMRPTFLAAAGAVPSA